MFKNNMNNNFASEMRNNSNNRVQQLVNNGQITLKQLKEMKSVDMSQCEKPITVMHKIYNPVSEVGLVTDVCTNVFAVDVTTEKGLEAFRDALKMAQTEDNATHVKYESIWMEGYNMHKNFNFTTGQYYVYYSVTNVEMKMLANRLSALKADEITMEEAQMIQADLPAIIRAWQESSIDVSKDKEKVFNFNFKQFFANISTVSSYIKKNRNEINFGFAEIKQARRNGKDLPDFKFQLKGLDNAVQDSVGICNMAFVEATEEYLNGDLKDIYAYSDNSILDKFTNYAIANPELALVIKQLISIVNNAFRNNITIDEAILADMRNYVYTKAIDLQIDKHDVINIAIATAMSKVYMNKQNKIVVETVTDNYNAAAIKQIFPNEYIEAFIGRPQRMELTIVDCDDIEDGQRIVFEHGLSTEEGLCEVEEDFTGEAYECDGKLVYDVDAYQFETVEALVVDKTYKQGTTTQDIKADADNKTTKTLDTGVYAISKLQQAKEIKLTGKEAHIVKANNEFIGRISVPNKELKGMQTMKYVFTLPALNGTQQLAFVVLQ